MTSIAAFMQYHVAKDMRGKFDEQDVSLLVAEVDYHTCTGPSVPFAPPPPRVLSPEDRERIAQQAAMIAQSQTRAHVRMTIFTQLIQEGKLNRKDMIDNTPMVRKLFLFSNRSQKIF